MNYDDRSRYHVIKTGLNIPKIVSCNSATILFLPGRCCQYGDRPQFKGLLQDPDDTA
jgi:hypothetical protein